MGECSRAGWPNGGERVYGQPRGVAPGLTHPCGHVVAGTPTVQRPCPASERAGGLEREAERTESAIENGKRARQCDERPIGGRRREGHPDGAAPAIAPALAYAEVKGAQLPRVGEGARRVAEQALPHLLGERYDDRVGRDVLL